ncbi:hypothetical protein MVLG_06717 [Microbotryum lychnidis-dioicae p1A1 Lamole]|uniref:Fungal-type protein kinase domain-containing protein n=1 Tax=Microbotryum lychnidis-dioicae (strain p1A1 Lamole / MvSl-1064) TaxID=683840 RepID=U5HI50_USTV1|nr:hypothetical protein MVLG_06717 [Microbotryum lychnidis-dioicae p1A1 Lamole]|eukprot:KDE02749.1 hypothetical protein MVLG_06717 [Microbotryum lychnidis-dioicae p1A1 Lamole]
MYSTQKLPLPPRHSVMSHAQLGETRCSDEQRLAPLGCSASSTSQLVSRVTRLRSLGFSSGESNDGDREIEWAGLKDFFLAPLTDDIDTTVVPEIVWEDGKPTLKSRGRLLSFQEDNKNDLYDPEALPDVFLFTHEVIKANPNIEATWTSTDDDQWGGLCSGTQLAAVAEIGIRPIDASPHCDVVYPQDRLRHSLCTLVSHSCRSHVFGFAMYKHELKIVLHTPSGRFCAPIFKCTEANGHLSTFLARLLSLSDRDLGIITSLCEDAKPTSFRFPSSDLPPRPTSFDKRRRGDPRLDTIQILEPLYWAAHTEYAMTVSFVEEARCDEHDRIRLAIANVSPDERKGLTHIVDVYRESDFVVVPRFLPKMLDAKAWGLKPRAMEVVFHEHCFEPISVVESTEALAQVMLGAVHGLRSLYRLRILHRDVSAANVMIASDGKGVLIDYDTAVFMDGPKGEAERRKSVPWHEIESLVYVAIFVVFILPKGASDPAEMSNAARGLWEHWKAPITGVLTGNVLLTSTEALQSLFEPYVEHWKHVPELVAALTKYCGLGVQRAWNERVDERAPVEPRWATGELSHDRLASDLYALIERIVQNNTSESE